jgi:hypothetical protein
MVQYLTRITSIFSFCLLAACAQALYGPGFKSCAPVYGNWCGENYPLTGFDPEPVDSWDRACRTHDLCYDSGKNKKSCDSKFRRTIRELSHDRLAPQAMANAYSWFTSDGYFQGFESFSTSVWAMTASCEGGDGKRAKFYCQSAFGVCRLSASAGPGQQGYPCHCGGAPGRILED